MRCRLKLSDDDFTTIESYDICTESSGLSVELNNDDTCGYMKDDGYMELNEEEELPTEQQAFDDAIERNKREYNYISRQNGKVVSRKIIFSDEGLEMDDSSYSSLEVICNPDQSLRKTD